jgi:hypothetical protein
MRTGEAMQRKTRTALILTSIALAFFAGIVLKYWMLR